MIWKPDATVACVVTQGPKFLIVEEKIQQQMVFNQPAGHIEEGESIIAAAQRETLEETGWQVEVTDFLLVGALREIAAGRRLDDRFDVFLRLVAQDAKTAVESLVGRDLGFPDPRPIDVHEEVVARTNAGVHVLQVDARYQGPGLSGLVSCRCLLLPARGQRHKGDGPH